jgi:hypothetical protein
MYKPYPQFVAIGSMAAKNQTVTGTYDKGGLV